MFILLWQRTSWMVSRYLPHAAAVTWRESQRLPLPFDQHLFNTRPRDWFCSVLFGSDQFWSVQLALFSSESVDQHAPSLGECLPEHMLIARGQCSTCRQEASNVSKCPTRSPFQVFKHTQSRSSCNWSLSLMSRAERSRAESSHKLARALLLHITEGLCSSRECLTILMTNGFKRIREACCKSKGPMVSTGAAWTRFSICLRNIWMSHEESCSIMVQCRIDMICHTYNTSSAPETQTFPGSSGSGAYSATIKWLHGSWEFCVSTFNAVPPHSTCRLEQASPSNTKQTV